MGVWAIVALFVTIALASTGSAHGGSPEDKVSMATLASSMNQRFQHLSDKFDRLELKLDRILQVKNGNFGGEIMDDDGLERPDDDEKVHPSKGSKEAQINAHVREAARLQKILSDVVSVPFCQRQAAHVRQPVVIAAVNTSQNVSCESYGKSLNSCLWGRRGVNGTLQVVVIDKEVVENGGRRTVDGMSFIGGSGDLDAGKCTLNIESLTDKDFGLWSCTLVTTNFTIFSGAVHISSANSRLISQDPNPEMTGNECENYRTRCLRILKQVFDEGQHCVPCPDCDITAEARLIAAEDKLRQKQRTLKDLVSLTAFSPTISNESAHAPRHIFATLNTSQVLPCESQGQPLSLCLWGQTIRGQSNGIIIDQQVVQDGGKTDVQGISYAGNGLQNGSCSIRITSVTQNDVGTWSCTLVSQAGTISKSEMQFRTQKIEPTIYFVSESGGLTAYSLATSQTTSIVSGGTNLYGVAYDSLRDRIYWSSSSTINRADRDGSNLETVFSTRTYGKIYTLKFDWIGGNLYAGTMSGYILVCYTGTKRALSCYTVLSGQGNIRGLTLDPNQGLMFWTTSNGAIVRAGMDGSDRTTIATYTNSSVKELRGITIDFESSRLFWVSANGDKILSSNMDGGDVETIISLPSESWPVGIGIFGDRIYWTNYNSKTVKSCTKTGRDVHTLYTGTTYPYHLAIVPELYPATVRTKDCEKVSCTKVCVLTPTSSRCLN